jgi:hypothetical protein
LVDSKNACPGRITRITFLARYRFLSSTLIIRLIGGSAQQILRSLQVLLHNGYLDRPTSQVAQLAHAFDFCDRPFLYGLGRAGAGRPVGKIEVDEHES